MAERSSDRASRRKAVMKLLQEPLPSSMLHEIVSHRSRQTTLCYYKSGAIDLSRVQAVCTELLNEKQK